MKKLKTPLIYLAIILVIVIAITGLEKGNSADSKKIEYTDFVAMVKRGKSPWWRSPSANSSA